MWLGQVKTWLPTGHLCHPSDQSDITINLHSELNMLVSCTSGSLQHVLLPNRG